MQYMILGQYCRIGEDWGVQLTPESPLPRVGMQMTVSKKDGSTKVEVAGSIVDAAKGIVSLARSHSRPAAAAPAASAPAAKAATYRRLPDDSWGVAGPGLTQGMRVTVSKKDGSTKVETVGEIVSTDEKTGVVLARVARVGKAAKAAPTTPADDETMSEAFVERETVDYSFSF